MARVRCTVITDLNGVMELDCDMPIGRGGSRGKRKLTTRNVCVSVKMKEQGKNMAQAQSECGKEDLSKYQAETDKRNRERG